MTSGFGERSRRIVTQGQRWIPGLRVVRVSGGWTRWCPVAAVALGGRVWVIRAPAGDDGMASLLAHELIHLRDQRRWGWRFLASYLLGPWPLWRTQRARWERRAYAMDLLLAHERAGRDGLAVAEARLRAVFAGPAYGWMWGGRSAAAGFLGPVRRAIVSGRLQRRSPYRELLAAWRGDQPTRCSPPERGS